MNATPENPAPCSLLPAVSWTEHPLIDLDPDYRRLTDEEFDILTPEEAEAYVKAREERLRLAVTDPLRHGFDLPHWRVIRHFLQQREEVYNFGGNDTAKTELLGKLTCEVLFQRLTFPGAAGGAPQILCIAQNDTMSKRVQQKRIYRFLPAELRKFNDSGAPKKRQATQKISYSDDGGFTNGSFSVARPRGAAVVFRNVTQFERNELAIEGDGFHFVPIDESAPLAFLDTLRYRAGKLGGRILYCFTPIGGFDSVCNNVFTGARCLAYLPMQWDWTYRGSGRGSRVEGREPEKTYRADGQFIPKGAEAIGQFLTGGINPEIQFPELDLSKSYVEGIPPGHMPFIMQPLKQEQIIVFTWSHWNPFTVRAKFNKFLPKTADKAVGRGSRVALIRIFGYTEKLQGAILSNFKPDYFPNGHLIKHADLLEILRTTPHNLRHGVDPATARSWFQGWKAVLPNGLDDRPQQYLVWESPNSHEGEWVTPDGEIGDGQRVFAGRDVDTWKIYIRETEAMLVESIRCGVSGVRPEKPDTSHLTPGTDPILRAGDARGFAAQTGEGTKYLELFYRDDSAKDPRLAPMIFRPAKVMATVWQDIHDAGKLIDLLACDWTKPVDATNHPHLLISDACQNFISCALHWDGKKQNLDGKPVNSPYADGVDMGRVLFDQEIPFMDPNQSCATGGGAW
jgi:hypothetical protein